MEDSSASGNPSLQLTAGYMYSYEQEYEKGLRATHNGYTLEQCEPRPSPARPLLFWHPSSPAQTWRVTPAAGSATYGILPVLAPAQAGTAHPNFA